MPDGAQPHSTGLDKIHTDYTNQPVSVAGPTKTISAAVSAVKQTVAPPETEYRRWRKTFDAFATEIDGEPYVYQSH
jgi:soluble cytochrome b562